MNIGYYAHHHGSGHCRQADKLAGLLAADCRHQLTVFTTVSADEFTFSQIDESQVVRLTPEEERDDDVLSGRPDRKFLPDSLHYSPVGNADIQERSWQLLDGIRRFNIDLMIIDVSVEVAMLCRVASIPYLYVRLAGNRDDAPHLNAFAGALGLLAPFPKMLESKDTPDWVCQKTLYLDFLPPKASPLPTFAGFWQQLQSLADNKNDDLSQAKTLITVIKGYGGHEQIDAKLPMLRQLWPTALIVSLGPISEAAKAVVDIAAEVDNVAPFIGYSDFVVMACGLNSVAEACQYQSRLVAIPDDRPHDEQHVMATALIAAKKAMSWSQFVEFSESSAAINPQNLPKQSLCQPSQNQQAALDFMLSLATADSAKCWFETWLLPRLKVLPAS